MATITPAFNFNAEEDAKTLRKAMKGIGTDEKAIIRVLAHRSNQQRQDIKTYFKQAYGKDLISELKSELGGDFERAILALMDTPLFYLIHELKAAMKGAGTNEKTLIEILLSKTNAELEILKLAYKKEYEKDLAEHVAKETSGNFKRLLGSILNAKREPEGDVDFERAKNDAQKIYDAGEGKFGTDESEINVVLCTRSWRQLRATFAAYQELAGHSMEEAIKKETSGDLQNGFLTIIKYITDPLMYYAERLHLAMKGLGTDDKTLIRIIVCRSELDLQYIKDAYEKMYGKSLADAVASECSGDYKRLLLEIIG